MKYLKSELVGKAQELLEDVIVLLEEACKKDEDAKAYMVDQLKCLCSKNHGFLSNNLNLDELVLRYQSKEEHVEIRNQYAEEIMERDFE